MPADPILRFFILFGKHTISMVSSQLLWEPDGHPQQLVVHLFEAVIAFIVGPIDKNGPYSDGWAIAAIAFVANKRSGNGGRN